MYFYVLCFTLCALICSIVRISDWMIVRSLIVRSLVCLCKSSCACRLGINKRQYENDDDNDVVFWLEYNASAHTHVLLIMLTSLAPSPIASVTVCLLYLTSWTTCAFWRGVTRQQITDWHRQHVSSSSCSISFCSACSCTHTHTRGCVLNVSQQGAAQITEWHTQQVSCSNSSISFCSACSYTVRVVRTHFKVSQQVSIPPMTPEVPAPSCKGARVLT